MPVQWQLVVEEETPDGVIEAVRAWLETTPGGREAAGETEEDRRERELRTVLGAIKGVDSLRLVRELAEAGTKGLTLRFDAALKARYGKTNGTAFAGIVSGPNKLMRRVGHRDLIARDDAVGGYRMDPIDAEIVLKVWSARVPRGEGIGFDHRR